MSEKQTIFSYEGYEDMRVTLQNGVLLVTLDNPDRLNALSTPIRHGLKRVLTEFEEDDNAKVMVITGEGRGFCSGADLGSTASYKQTAVVKEADINKLIMIQEIDTQLALCSDNISSKVQARLIDERESLVGKKIKWFSCPFIVDCFFWS